MMTKLYSNEEMQKARNINLALFLIDFYDPYRYELNDRGYLLDAENPDWVGDVRNNHWYDNSPNAKHPHGNIIDYLMFFENCTFRDAMSTLMEYVERNAENQENNNDDFENPFA